MERFWDILMSVFKLARGIIALVVLLFVGLVIWSLYTASHAIDDARSKTSNAVGTPPAAIGSTSAQARSSTNPPLAAASKPAPSLAVSQLPSPTPPPSPAPAPPQPTTEAPSVSTPSAIPVENLVKPENKVEEKGPVSLSVTRIGRGSNQFVGENYVSLASVLKNEGKKTIKAMKGTIVIFDAFGDELARLGVENAKTIKPGQSVKESGEWNIMFNSKAQNAINGSGADKSKLTFSFVPKLILFDDGTRLEQ